MPECPACNRSFDVDIELLNAHVASHYGDGQDPLAAAIEGESGYLGMKLEGSNSSGHKRKCPDDELVDGDEPSKTYVTCYVCGPSLYWSEYELRETIEIPECFICGRTMEGYTDEERQMHVNECLGPSELFIAPRPDLVTDTKDINLSDSTGGEQGERTAYESAVLDEGRYDQATGHNKEKSFGGRLVQLGSSGWKAGNPRQQGDLW
jgi:hypothetical protein